jgi:hypothetical protein
MRRLSVSLIALLALAMPLRAQESSTIGAFELRPMVGAFIPTGSMRNDFRDATLVGLQGGFEFSSNIHMLLGGFWSRNDPHVTFIGSKHADIWQFDAGAEANSIVSMGRDWLFRPFVGGGSVCGCMTIRPRPEITAASPAMPRRARSSSGSRAPSDSRRGTMFPVTSRR